MFDSHATPLLRRFFLDLRRGWLRNVARIGLPVMLAAIWLAGELHSLHHWLNAFGLGLALSGLLTVVPLAWRQYWTFVGRKRVIRRVLLHPALRRMERKGFHYAKLSDPDGQAIFVQLEGRFRGFFVEIYVDPGLPPKHWPRLLMVFHFNGRPPRADGVWKGDYRWSANCLHLRHSLRRPLRHLDLLRRLTETADLLLDLELQPATPRIQLPNRRPVEPVVNRRPELN